VVRRRYSSAPGTVRRGARTTSDGIIRSTPHSPTTPRSDRRRPEKARFDLASVKYVIITPPTRRGRRAKLMQDVFASRIVNREATGGDRQSSTRFARTAAQRESRRGGPPGLTLAGSDVTVVPMPGHTPGTLSLIFPGEGHALRARGVLGLRAAPSSISFNDVAACRHLQSRGAQFRAAVCLPPPARPF